MVTFASVVNDVEKQEGRGELTKKTQKGQLEKLKYNNDRNNEEPNEKLRATTTGKNTVTHTEIFQKRIIIFENPKKSITKIFQ